MKLMKVNLCPEPSLQERILLPGIVFMVLAALALSAYTTDSYLARQREITAYEQQIASVRNRADANGKRPAPRKMAPEQKKGLAGDMAFIRSVLVKKMAPVSQILDDIEISRPEKLRIDALVFSQNFYHIKGTSSSPKDVSAFLLALDQTGRFSVHVSRGQIDEQKKILFAITLDRKTSE